MFTAAYDRKEKKNKKKRKRKEGKKEGNEGGNSFRNRQNKINLLNGIFWLPRWLSGKEFTCQSRRGRFNPWVRKILTQEGMAIHSSIFAWIIPWKRRLADYSSRGHKESDNNEQLNLLAV